MKNEDSQFVKIDIDVICDDMNNVKLSDGTIYVLNSDNGFVYEAQTAMKFWLMILERQHNGYIYDYKISVIHDTSAWLEHGILYEAIKDGVNIVLPISTPNTEKQQYIVAKANQETAGSCITNMIVKAEKLTKSAIEEALMNLAVQEPKHVKMFSEMFAVKPYLMTMNLLNPFIVKWLDYQRKNRLYLLKQHIQQFRQIYLIKNLRLLSIALWKTVILLTNHVI